MRLFALLNPSLLDGSRKERAAAIYALAAWFCMGAFVCSVLAYYVDALTTASLSSPWIPILGGALTSLVALFKAA